MSEPAFSSFARELVLLHTLAAIVLVGAVTHHAVIALRILRGEQRTRVARVHAATSAAAYAATLLLGALAYPAFRVVRARYLDVHASWASSLFELKEDLAAVGAVAALGAWLLARVIDARHDRELLPGYVALALIATGTVWFDVTSGLLVTMVKSV